MLDDIRLHFMSTPEQRRQVEVIDRVSYPDPFDWFTLAGSRGQSIIVRVAEYGRHCVVGFAVYRISRGRLEILRVAVDPPFRRQGVARRLVTDLIGRSASMGRDRLYATVPETDRASLELFKACGFGRSWLIRQASGPDYVGMACEIGVPAAAIVG